MSINLYIFFLLLIFLFYFLKIEFSRSLILTQSELLIKSLIFWDTKESRDKIPEALHHILEVFVECSKDSQFFEKKFLIHLLPLLQILPHENFYKNKRKEEAVKGDPVFLIHQSLTHLISIFAEKFPNAPEFLVHSQYLVLPLKIKNDPKEDELENQKLARLEIPEHTINYLFISSQNSIFFYFYIFTYLILFFYFYFYFIFIFIFIFTYFYFLFILILFLFFIFT